MNEVFVVKAFKVDFVSDTLLIIMGAKGTKNNVLGSFHLLENIYL